MNAIELFGKLAEILSKRCDYKFKLVSIENYPDGGIKLEIVGGK